jgi:hypothetical protein
MCLINNFIHDSFCHHKADNKYYLIIVQLHVFIFLVYHFMSQIKLSSINIKKDKSITDVNKIFI